MTSPPLFVRLEKAFIIAILILYSGGPFTVLLSGGYSQGDPGSAPADYPIMKLVFISTYCIFAALLACRWRQTLQTLLRDRLTLPLVAIVAGSYVWSATPSETFAKSVAFVGSTLLGIYLAGRYSKEELLRLLAWAFGGIVCLSFFYAIALPKYGIMGGVHKGDWRGIYTHKNTLGRLMVLSVQVFLLRSLQPKRQGSNARFWSLLGLAGSMALILLCTSVGALVNVSAVIGSTFAFLILKRWSLIILIPSLIASITFALASGVWISQNLELIAELLNKDVTLTGRTDIWGLTFEKFTERPWFGYGYYGFWNGFDSEAGDVWRAYGWETPNAHNGLLDIAIQLGFIGLSLLIISLFYHAILSIIQLRQSQSVTHIWPLTFMVYMLLGSIPESSLLIPNDLFWIFYVTLSLQPYQLTQSRLYAQGIPLRPNPLQPPPPPPPAPTQTPPPNLSEGYS